MMDTTTQTTKIEYGDFQTPLALTKQVCQKLQELGISPEIIIEPTCGIGNFVETSAQLFPLAKQIIGIDINPAYLENLERRKTHFPDSQRITLQQGNFFEFNWKGLLTGLEGSLLVLGNFPWVTNSKLGVMGSTNLPTKHNFQNYKGIEAMTGKGNFDISEWMLIQTAHWLQPRNGFLAILCKLSVARKFLSYLHSKQIGLSRAVVYGIDAKKHFGASVEACLLICEFETHSHHYDYQVYDHLDSLKCQRVGHRHGRPVRDLDTFDKLSHWYENHGTQWHSGVKHDCSDVMELQQVNGGYRNGLGELVTLEPTYLFPLFKGSDIANHRTDATNRYLLVTQKVIGEPTDPIRHRAPKTWEYLESHASYLDGRKSRIYQNQPRYSIFGVGDYTFAPHKIAICSLYKNLDFRLIIQRQEKPAVFDDTVYFLSFETAMEAKKTFQILTSSLVKEFYSALIFWDEKRPIKTSVLNCLNLSRFENIPSLQPRTQGCFQFL